MPDFEYTSPRTGQVYVVSPDDQSKTPTQESYDWIANKVEQMETGTEQSALGSFGSAVGQGLTTMPGTVLQGVGAMEIFCAAGSRSLPDRPDASG